MERSGTQGRKLGARVPASGLQQWKLQAPGKETDTDRGTGRAKQSQRGNKKQAERLTEREIQKFRKADRERDSKSNRERQEQRQKEKQ